MSFFFTARLLIIIGRSMLCFLFFIIRSHHFLRRKTFCFFSYCHGANYCSCEVLLFQKMLLGYIRWMIANSVYSFKTDTVEPNTSLCKSPRSLFYCTHYSFETVENYYIFFYLSCTLYPLDMENSFDRRDPETQYERYFPLCI